MGLERRWLQAVTTAIAICLLSVSQGGASLVRAREGGSAELGCSLTPTAKEATTPNLFPLHVVEWVRLGFNVPILIKFGVYAPRVHPNYKGRVSLTRGASLLVERLTLEDEGWFECRILLLDSKKDNFRNGTWTFLSITAPPIFIKTPPKFVEVLLGESLTLSCGAHGNPRPTVVWHKDESRIEKHEKIKVLNGTLSMASVTRNISGVYTCHVSNTEGNLTHTTQLQVKGPPIIIISPEDTTLNMSQDAVLQCQADAYPSNLTYEWVKQGQNVYHIESLKSRVKVLVDGTLLIPNLIPEDAGNYTCIPTNGILTPPSASAHLKVKHPARVGRMSRETYLPSGMGGVIVCPVQADPPVLYVNWTKDGNDLNLDNFPGWMVNSEGSVFITTANDNAVGMYTCTPYNSYGTMGQSEPTKVILQDPPTFKVLPRPEYLQEVGREMIIPCEAIGDPTPNITWSKIGSTPRSPYIVLANGSLLLQPLSKDHQGGWECLATNRVATVSAGTVIMVLGTSPHVVSSVFVITEMNQANVSWVPGFDGGYTQKFTVWVKQASRGKHEWASLPVPTSKNYLLVTALLAGTGYQFSVLPQNKLGSGPFSEIVTVRTQAVPTEEPTAVTNLPNLEPPILLMVNRTEQGVLLQWSPPEAPSSPLTGYVLHARRDQSHWVILSSNISANQSELLVQGLLRDSSYDLRLMSRSNKILSEPSESVNVSTIGMEVYPVRPGFLEFIPEPLLAGVLGGVCFLFVAIVLSLVTACYMSQRRRRRRRKRRQDLPSALQKTLSPEARSPPRSPDSVLKLKLCPPLPFFPNSSSSQSDRSSFDKGSRGEYHDQRKQLLSNSSPPPHYTLFESHLGSQAPSPTALESISRGPDGRFIVQPLLERSSPSNNKILNKEVLQINGGAGGLGSNRASLRDSPKSSILSSEKDERRDSPLTVDVPELSRPPPSPGRVRALARNLSRHGCFYSDDEQGSEALLERASFYSDNSEKKPSDSLRRCRMQAHADDLFPSLARKTKLLDRDRGYQAMESQLTNNSTLVSHLESELERDSITKCAQLAKEREEMERELESYTADQRSRGRGRDEQQSGAAESPHREASKSEEEPIWKPQDVAIRQKHRPSGQTSRVSDYRKACYFGNTSSPMDRLQSSRIQWDISPVTSITSLIPAQSPRESTSPRSQHHRTCRETTEDSIDVDSSRSPVTQNTSLPMFSPNVTSQSPPVLYPERARSLSPQRDTDLCRKSMTEQGLRENKDEGVTRFRHSYAYAGAQHWDPAARGPSADGERPTSSASVTFNQQARTAGGDQTATRDLSPSSYSTLPFEHREVGAKAKEKDSRARDDRRSSGFYSELEREGVRTRSRRSDKCLFSDSPSPITTLTLVEEVESDQSQFSVPGMSGSFKAKPAAPSPKMSPLQTSAILEYLSLPGFIEMSVDEPVEGAEDTNTARQSSEVKKQKSPGAKPDVVPKNWEVHVQESRDTDSNRKVCFEENHSAAAAETGFYPGKKQSFKSSLPVEARDPSNRVRFPDETRGVSPGPEKTCRQLYDEKTQLRGGKEMGRPESRLGSRSAHTLFSAAKGMADIVAKHSKSFADSSESLSEQPQRQASQGSRANNIASRICQAPVPFLKKSLSMGPCRTLSGLGHPRPFLKKSISLGSQRWEHFESPRTYISEKCYWDEFPHPDVRVKSYSLGRSPPSFPRPGPSWREYIPFRRPSMGSLERLHPAQRNLASPPYLTQPMYPPRQASMSPMMESSDPRRQAAVFPDSSRWSPSYQDNLRHAHYVPMPSSIPVPQYQPWPGYRGESARPMEPRRGPPRSYLPRGISWPSPYYAPFPPREAESYRQSDRMMGRGGETEIREGGRASYASQSSGRGSAGLFRQSLSITPTLLSSPETTEESERHRAESELLERRAKRRNTSVDESYEWDSADVCVDSEVLEATRFDQSQKGLRRGRAELRPDQAGGFQDRRQKGPSPSVSPPVSIPPRCQYSRSLSEARFNALRQEYQEYRRTQESICSREPCLTPGHETDSDTNSALL
ncbi:protein turtle homolog A [Notolabrus celidotus]|uniref:protein turtle homolog A n=1 Tax=Notolabrus celidotus TaxID=1203425 RepID=UPI0014905A0E|nr:protein turtle homolog A [Notolabrus celidotus]XP_034548783.1 protein turtle homolog A [Notolabrus celidotus]XP_034548784.1 protein turtle homolog A [Notolabrus celidotus]